MNDADLIFDYLEISGFMSFPPDQVQRLELNTNRLATIIGENLDGGSGERNGAGKTAIIDSLHFAVFGRTTRMSNSGFINYTSPGTLLVAVAGRRAGTAFRVERGENPSLLRLFEKPTTDPRDFQTKQSGKYIFDQTKSTKPETTKRIAELLGFDLKLADVLLVNNPSDKSCFFLKNEEEQRAIVERLFGFTVFTEKAERLRELRKEQNKNLATKESALIATRQANDRIWREIGSLEEKSNAWAAERDRALTMLTEQIDTFAKIDFNQELSIQKQIDKITADLTQFSATGKTQQETWQRSRQQQEKWQRQQAETVAMLRETIAELQHADAQADIQNLEKLANLMMRCDAEKLALATARREYEGGKRQVETEQNARNRIAKQIENIEKQIAELNDAKCPTCGQDWTGTAEHLQHCLAEYDRQKAELAVSDTTIADLQRQLQQTREQAVVLEKSVLALQDAIDESPSTTFKSVEEASRASARLNELKHKLTEEETAKNPHDETVAQIEQQINANQAVQRQLHTRLSEMSGTVFKTLQEAQSALSEYENMQKQRHELQQIANPYRETIDNLRDNLLKPVDDSEIVEIRRQIAHLNLLISLLADRDSPIRKSVLNDWLPELNRRVNQYLAVLELPHQIVFDADMTAMFTLNQKKLGFGNLSTGQRLRVWLATNLAFREIFELINYKINLFFVDEALDKGMSGRGAEVSYQLLQRMAEQQRSVFLITHRQELVDMSTEMLTVTLKNGLSSLTQ